jgi:glycogen debranching enzyme
MTPRPRTKDRQRHGTETGPYYIQARSPAADELSRVLKQGETFAVFDHYGDVKPVGLGEEGLFHEGTRYLSCLLLLLGDERPLFLSSTVKEDNEFLTVDLTNPDLSRDNKVVVPRGTLHVSRTKFLWSAASYEHLRLRNYGLAPIHATLRLEFDADYADIFEVRGTRRPRRGERLDSTVKDNHVTLAYEGLDHVVRQTHISFSPRPAAVSEEDALWEFDLAPQQEKEIEMIIACQCGKESGGGLSFDDARRASGKDLDYVRHEICTLRTSNDQFNTLLRRTVADLHMLTTRTPQGLYPCAGVPWFSTPFGRDGIITALQCLWIQPSLARGTLAYLAATQATEVNAAQDAEPGKILHETRGGEMAALGEVPFRRYYGSVDATPLFVLLAGQFYHRTGDRAFIESIWPNVRRALEWIERYGDRDGDGFVEYYRQSANGLTQQGWKDSWDSVWHADGALAEGPIALCEVQGYVYGAWQAAAVLSEALGQSGDADGYRSRASRLRTRFAEAFWQEDLGMFALALDGSKRRCCVRTSNAGQCLLTGIAQPEHAARIGEEMLTPKMFSGWGIRTVAEGEARYNPMSYHNGSIWPHDNSLIADGLARYGFKGGAQRILTGLFDVSLFMDLHRLPELFCGFPRRAGEGPTLYPVACSPQAWAAASVLLLLQVCLGLEVDGVRKEITFHYPVLPEFLREVHIHDLRVGDAAVDLLLLRHGEDVGINVTRKQGAVRVQMVK